MGNAGIDINGNCQPVDFWLQFSAVLPVRSSLVVLYGCFNNRTDSRIIAHVIPVFRMPVTYTIAI